MRAERIEPRDRRALGALLAEARTIDLRGDGFWRDGVAELARLLRARCALMHNFRAGEHGAELDRLVTSGMSCSDATLREAYDNGLRRQTGYLAYSPLRPERNQRNRVLTLAEVFSGGRVAAMHQDWRRLGTAGHDQLRVLVCRRGTLLGWVGALRPGEQPFGARERTLLSLALPLLKARLAREHELRDASRVHATLDVVLEALGRSALVIDTACRVHFANALGGAWLQRSTDALTELRRALAGTHPALHASKLDPGRFLVLGGAVGAPPLGNVAARWGLTSREAEVLEHVAKGLSNRELAAELHCSERTIETHLTRLMEKSECSGRAQLIAKLWGRV